MNVKQLPGEGYSEHWSQYLVGQDTRVISGTLTFSLSRTGSYQHYVRFWGSNPELPGGKQVNLSGGLCGQSGDVDRVASVAGGSSRPGSGLASGKPRHALNLMQAVH